MAGTVDPEIAAFNDWLTARWREHPPLSDVTLDQARAIAEAVRAPLRLGGPAMVRTREFSEVIAGHIVRLRLYYPVSATALPAFIYLHGGGFTLFSIDTHDRLMREYAAATGAVVIGVDYPLSPEARFPAALECVAALPAWLAERKKDLDIDLDRLAMGGDSAGANLSVAACMKWRDTGEAIQVKALLLNYGAFTATCSDEAEEQLGGPGAVLNRNEMAWFYGNYLPDDIGLDNPLACPINGDMTGLPPTMFAIAGQDILAEQSHQVAQLLKAAAVPCLEKVYPGATHSFLEAMATSALARQAIMDGASWLSGHLS